MDLLEIGIMAPMILLALALHESAHAWTARHFGDSTAEDLGRISLNPVVHLDLWGTLTFIFTGGSIGWGKPVPYNPLNLRDRRRAELAIAAAGPLSNLVLGGILRLVILALPRTGALSGGFLSVLDRMMAYGIVLNASLCLFNLLPVFPLDGFRVWCHALPSRLGEALEGTAPYGFMILLGMVLLENFGIPTLSLVMRPGWFLLSRYVYFLG